jgi:hypothetical protein
LHMLLLHFFLEMAVFAMFVLTGWHGVMTLTPSRSVYDGKQYGVKCSSEMLWSSVFNALSNGLDSCAA